MTKSWDPEGDASMEEQFGAPMTTVPEELKPCPFCGGDAEGENTVTEAVLRCCLCKAKISRKHSADEDTGCAEVTEAWNRRAAISPPIDAGWQAVPTKHDGLAGLTHDMCDAFWNAYREHSDHHGHFESTNVGYNALLAAAPPHPAPIDGRGEAVAWRWRTIAHDSKASRKWQYETNKPDPDQIKEILGPCTVEPLYTHPAPAPGPADAVSEAEAALRTVLGHVHNWLVNTPWDRKFLEDAQAIDAVVLDAINAKHKQPRAEMRK